MKDFLTENASGIWYTEYHTKYSGITLRIKETLYNKKSKYQNITIIDTYEYGKMLLLDNLIMLTEKDEYIYHEMITHIPVNIVQKPEKALIIGGGDCGTLRELSQYKSIRSIKMVEIDGDVVDVSRKYLPFLFNGISDNAEIIIDDGIKYLNNTKESFDIIIIDSTDPIGPAEGLFNADFYSKCANRLTENGVIVTQAESPYFHPNACKKIYNNLKNVFSTVIPYLAFIPTYPSGMWQFMIAGKEENIFNKSIPTLREPFQNKLKYYNQEIHRAAFALPQFVKKLYDL